MNKLIRTAEKIEVPNYPYGFKLRTTLTDFIEFSPKKGYRHCTQTVDPRNGRMNAPKKSTYYPLMVRYYNEAGHIKTFVFHFNGREEINKGCEFIAENFDLFSPEEIKYFYTLIFSMSAIDFKASCIYGGCQPDAIKKYYSDFWEIVKNGIKAPQINFFPYLKLDAEKIEAEKPVDYNPFKVTHYSTGLSSQPIQAL